MTGHVPTALGLTKAVEAGMDQVAHLPINGDPQSPQTRATIELLAKHKTVIDPTLPWNELLGHAPETPLESFEPGFAHAPPALLANYRSVKNDTDAATAKRRVRDSQTMVKALFDAGVPIVAGTDGALPGYSLLRSIEMYVEAGMTPMQAIESATRVPAESMGLGKDTGTIEAGQARRHDRVERRSARADLQHPQAPLGGRERASARTREAVDRGGIQVSLTRRSFLAALLACSLAACREAPPLLRPSGRSSF